MVLAICAYVSVNAQMKIVNSQNVLMARVSHTQAVQIKTIEENKIIQLNREIRSYDEQIAELQKQKAQLNNEINTVFEEHTVKSAPASNANSLTAVELKLKNAVRVYMENTKTLKVTLSTLSDRSKVTNAIADDLAEACRLAKSSQYMKEEAYSLATDQGKANMLANALEKMEQARVKQEIVIQLLEEPAGPSVLCLHKR